MDLKFYLSMSLLLSTSFQATVTISNPGSHFPISQIFHNVLPSHHCCLPLDLEIHRQRGWFRAGRVIYSDLDSSPSLVYGYSLVGQHASCRGESLLRGVSHSSQYISPIIERRSLGGTMWKRGQSEGEVSSLSAEPAADMMFPEFIVYQRVHYELIRTLREARIYENLHGDIIVGRTQFLSMSISTVSRSLKD